MESVLTSIKKLLGIEEDYEHFDPDIIIWINSAFEVVRQLGIGNQDEAFTISDKTAKWEDFIRGEKNINAVKTYIYLRVRNAFDPPSSSAVMDAYEKMIREHEWRLNVEVDKFPHQNKSGYGDGGTGSENHTSPSSPSSPSTPSQPSDDSEYVTAEDVESWFS